MIYSTVLLKIGYKIRPILLQGMRFIFNILGLRFVHICYSTADDLFFYKGDHPFLLLWLVFIHYVTGDDIHPFQLLLIVSSITVIRDEIHLLGITFISKCYEILNISITIADIHPFIYWGMGCASFLYVTGDDIQPLLLLGMRFLYWGLYSSVNVKKF